MAAMGNANRAYAESDLPEGSTGAKSGILDCLVGRVICDWGH